MESSTHLSPKQFSELSGLSLATVHRYLRCGRLPYTQLGGRRHRILIPFDALDQVHKQMAEGPPLRAEAADRPSRQGPRSGPTPRWMRD
jgi:hypothetical protein